MKRVLVDAGFHPETGHGSIACVFEDGLPLSRVVQVASSVQGELCAIREAMEEAANRRLGAKEVLFVCDCESVVAKCNSKSRSKDGFVKPIQRALRRHPDWRLEWRPRDEVEEAHHLAAITYEAWLEGVRSAEAMISMPMREPAGKTRRHPKRRPRRRAVAAA